MTSLQNRALGRGMLATIQRTKERTVINLKISVAPHVDRQGVIDTVKHGLLARAGLNPATTSIEQVDDSSSDKDTIAQLMRENQDLRRKLAAATLIEADPEQRARRWMRPREAAEELGISKSTLYRAIEEGRIATKSDKVISKKNHEVDPKTFKRKQRTKKNQQN